VQQAETGQVLRRESVLAAHRVACAEVPAIEHAVDTESTLVRETPLVPLVEISYSKSLPAPTTEGTPSMIMAPISMVLGRGTYLFSMRKAAGFRRLCGLHCSGTRHGRSPGFDLLTGLVGS